jgi:hypothetical protein
VNWTFTAADKQWFSVFYVNNLWCILSPNGYIGTSTNGVNWKIQSMP